MTECSLELLFLLVSKLSFAFSAYVSIDIVRHSSEIPQSQGQLPRLTNLELSCFSKEQIPYGDSCYPLLERGPCNEGEWLILDMESATLEEPHLVGLCTEKQCNYNDIFWPLDGYCYNVTEGESNLCPERGTVLHVDPFGEGICDCKRDKAYVRWFTSDEYPVFRCFEAYTRGPCDEGFIVVKQGVQVLCQEDLCIKLQAENARYTYLEEDKRCHRIGSRGPCKKDEQLLIHPESKNPTCVPQSSSLPLYLIQVPKTCKTDHAGDCVDAIEISSNTDRFTNQLIQLANEKKRKAS